MQMIALCKQPFKNNCFRSPNLSPGGTDIERFKVYSAAKTGLQHLRTETMIKVPDEIKEEFNNFRIAGGFKKDKGKSRFIIVHCL